MLFFPLVMYFAGPAVPGSRLVVRTRRVMVTSGALAFAGLSGAVVGDTQLKDVGIFVYVGVFFIVSIPLAVLVQRTRPDEA